MKITNNENWSQKFKKIKNTFDLVSHLKGLNMIALITIRYLQIIYSIKNINSAFPCH